MAAVALARRNDIPPSQQPAARTSLPARRGTAPKAATRTDVLPPLSSLGGAHVTASVGCQDLGASGGRGRWLAGSSGPDPLSSTAGPAANPRQLYPANHFRPICQLRRLLRSATCYFLQRSAAPRPHLPNLAFASAEPAKTKAHRPRSPRRETHSLARNRCGIEQPKLRQPPSCFTGPNHIQLRMCALWLSENPPLLLIVCLLPTPNSSRPHVRTRPLLNDRRPLRSPPPPPASH